jgi:DNA polymerase-3 subunit gamma/tau
VAGQALYRKYRSGTFAEIIGQDHVVQTLQAAIANGRLSHAYLFTGPRGVGKTSVARILARALNCTGDPKPCNQCPNCLAAINSSLDVVEIDAASNRSIDAVRDLREKIGLAPTQGKFKVYIIDEVHMLTTEAFNALLKTLEEPPAHAVFIMATTEAHKLPDTIVSRTQRYNFRPITQANLVKQLGAIAKSEDIAIDQPALEIIATAARGGSRDAISLLDQVGSLGGGPVSADTVRELLGYTTSEELAALAEAIAAHDPAAALQVLARLEDQGAQAGQVATQLATLWRSVLHAAAAPLADPTVAKLAAAVPPRETATIIETLLEVVRSHWPQAALEAAIVKLTVPASQPMQTNKTSKATAEETGPSHPARKEELPKETNSAGTLSKDLWPKVLIVIKSQNNSLCALLQMYPVEFTEGEITIKPRFNFHRDLFLKPATRQLIEAAATKVYGRPVKIGARTEDGGAGAKKRKTTPDPNAELVSSALEILGGEIVE